MKSLAATALLLLAQGMPVTRLADGVPAPGAAAQPPAERPLPPAMPVAQVTPGPAAATLDSPRRLSLSFSESRPLEEVLRLLVAATPFSLAIDPDVTGTFRGELKQLTLRDALTALLGPLRDQYEVRGTVLRITRIRAETRAFDVNLLAMQRGLTRTIGGSGAEIRTTVVREDAFAGVRDGVQALLSPSGTVHVDPHAGLVEVTDDRERVDRVAQYLEALEVRSNRQVRLQARVFEIVLKHGAAINWRAVRETLGMPADAPEAGLTVDPAALQAALASQGDIRVLSAPEVTALNNEPALVRAATPGVSALTLTVVPQIAAGGVVQLSVSHSWEEQAAGEKAARVTQADTVTRVMDGSTVLIAGLLRPAQIAAASHGIGSLFGAQAKTTVQTELVVLLRATIVTAGYR